MKTQMAHKGGLIKPPLLTMSSFITNKRLKSHLQLFEVAIFSKTPLFKNWWLKSKISD